MLPYCSPGCKMAFVEVWWYFVWSFLGFLQRQLHVAWKLIISRTEGEPYFFTFGKSEVVNPYICRYASCLMKTYERSSNCFSCWTTIKCKGPLFFNIFSLFLFLIRGTHSLLLFQWQFLFYVLNFLMLERLIWANWHDRLAIRISLVSHAAILKTCMKSLCENWSINI